MERTSRSTAYLPTLLFATLLFVLGVGFLLVGDLILVQSRTRKWRDGLRTRASRTVRACQEPSGLPCDTNRFRTAVFLDNRAVTVAMIPLKDSYRRAPALSAAVVRLISSAPVDR